MTTLAGAILIIAGIYLKINWILYLGIIVLLSPLLIILLAIFIGIFASIYG